MKDIKFGMVVMVEIPKPKGIILSMGIIVLSSETFLAECSIEKYRGNDEKPTYKVNLIPVENRLKPFFRTMYLSDLESGIRNGRIQIKTNHC